MFKHLLLPIPLLRFLIAILTSSHCFAGNPQTVNALATKTVATKIGFREAEVPDSQGNRPLHLSLWYPAGTMAEADHTGAISESIGENRVFYGVAAIRNAEPESVLHPLVVLSHGYGGNWKNLGWLAGELANQGYVVAAPDHPGTTTFDRRPSEAKKLSERPNDLSRIITYLLDAHVSDQLPGHLLEPQALAGGIDPERIAAIGHSLGGWTVTALAGGRFDIDLFSQECHKHPNPRICGLSSELGINQEGMVKAPLDGDLSDSRVRAIVSLDLGLARGFTPESLGAVRIPVLVFGAGVDIGDLPADMESGYLAAHFPSASSHYEKIADAAHFSFMQLCKPGAVALLEEDFPGEGIVCKDGGGRSRREIHRQVADLTTRFLGQSLHFRREQP